jgi:glutamate---cysteine ligase / carboxylate-amine ligase
VVDELGCREELAYVHTMLENGSSADRQLRVYRESGGDLQAVVDLLMKETVEGVM